VPTDPLPPDPESVEKWRSLPQNKPSRDALPPATGGLGMSRTLLFGFGALVLLALLISLLFGR
jgi:hypothetical protein